MMAMFFLILLFWLMLPVLAVFFYILFGCFLGFKRVFEVVNRGQRLFTLFVAWIFFLLGMAFTIVPVGDAISEKYLSNIYKDNNNSKFSNIVCYMIEGFREDTVYALGYTEKNFNKIEIGMTPEQVLELVGEPLKKSGRDECYWEYTALRENDRCYCYWVREVYFGPDKKVSKIDTSYWWD